MKARAVGSPRKKVGAKFAGATILLCAIGAHAAGVDFQFDTPFPAGPSPAGPGPWLDAAFQDLSPGTVILTISNVNLAAGEFIGGNGNGTSGGLFFNLNPNLNATQLSFTLIGSLGVFASPTIQTGNNTFKADGDGYYDIQFDFATSETGRFTGGDSVSYTVTGIPTLTAADFYYVSAPAGGSGPFYAAAHIQGLSGGASTWIEPSRPVIVPVPEPGATALSAMGCVYLAGRGLRGRKQAGPG